MAGAGYKLFNTGDVLTAAQVNTYLQEQAVMRFANAAARTSALSSVLAEGMVSYLMDTNTMEVYDGSTWIGVAAGDITAVTTAANSGLAGGATSGAVALTLATAAKGDLLVGTGSNTASALTVGSNGTVLTADSTTATGLKWATSASSAVVAVKAAYKSDTFSTTSTSFTDITDLSITYTPTSASNKILLLATVSATGQVGTSGFNLRFVRGSTAIGVGDASGGLTQATASTQATDSNNPASVAISFLDSPATTSSTTYKVQMKLDAGTGYVNRSSSDAYARNSSNFLLLEVTP